MWKALEIHKEVSSEGYGNRPMVVWDAEHIMTFTNIVIINLYQWLNQRCLP